MISNEPSPHLVYQDGKSNNKRRTLTQVLDKLASQASSNEQQDQIDEMDTMSSDSGLSESLKTDKSPMSFEEDGSQGHITMVTSVSGSPGDQDKKDAEEEPKQQQQSVICSPHRDPLKVPVTLKGDVFRFDSFDKERYLFRTISEEDDVFSPQRSPRSATNSPSIASVDSPKLNFSPLRIKDSSIDEDEKSTLGVQAKTQSSHTHCHSIKFPPCDCYPYCKNLAGQVLDPLQEKNPDKLYSGVPMSPPVTPSTPISPTPFSHFEQYIQNKYIADLFKRSRSESDLTGWFDRSCDSSYPESPRETVLRHGRPIPHPLYIPSKRGSLESDQSTPQDSPLDLSLKTGSRESMPRSPRNIENDFVKGGLAPPFMLKMPLENRHSMSSPLLGSPIRRGSPRERNLLATPYSPLEVSPDLGSGADLAYVCQICGQMFSLHDRLAKHMASRHKKPNTDTNTKTYMCEVCKRSFTRSDMLTRHMRLHTGIKPYTCRTCGQVFSRSDHLSTHQRTHTGEKPYKCPQCPYAACRRDMITRHMRTHTRYDISEEHPLSPPVLLRPHDSSPSPSTSPSEAIPLNPDVT